MSERHGLSLEARGLLRRFGDGEKVIEVVRDLDLVVAPGESVAVIGESGVGKSTLLHLLGALDRPDGGNVRLGDRDLFSLPAAELARTRNREIGFVFQFHHLLGDFDALENVMMPLLVGGKGWGAARKRAGEMLERVGLGARLDHRPGQLSGGEQQRVAVARAIVGEPSVILADEPTGNLDPGTAHDVQDLLGSLQREAGCSMVIATHSEALAAAMDRKLRMAGGKLHNAESHAPPEEGA
jgi:lipoprotein-releasing system ATP-binding protein